MSRKFVALAPIGVIALSAARPAQAHLGHVGELAGHDHWVAGAAIGAAAAIGLWGALKGKKHQDAEPDAPAETPEEETA